ncbi:MAG: cyclic nucleotide-binding domain-containing protein [Acidobacteriota bacterium]
MSLEALFIDAGHELETVGNDSIPLDSADRVFLVAAGEVELFATRGAKQSRHHVTTVGRGGMLFGAVPLSTTGSRLVAVTLPDTRLIEIDRSSLRALARDDKNLDGLAQAIEAWVTGLFSDIPRNAAPREFEPVTAGGEVALEDADASARIAGGKVVWVRHVKGSSCCL